MMGLQKHVMQLRNRVRLNSIKVEPIERIKKSNQIFYHLIAKLVPILLKSGLSAGVVIQHIEDAIYQSTFDADWFAGTIAFFNFVSTNENINHDTSFFYQMAETYRKFTRIDNNAIFTELVQFELEHMGSIFLRYALRIDLQNGKKSSPLDKNVLSQYSDVINNGYIVLMREKKNSANIRHSLIHQPLLIEQAKIDLKASKGNGYELINPDNAGSMVLFYMRETEQTKNLAMKQFYAYLAYDWLIISAKTGDQWAIAIIAKIQSMLGTMTSNSQMISNGKKLYDTLNDQIVFESDDLEQIYRFCFNLHGETPATQNSIPRWKVGMVSGGISVISYAFSVLFKKWRDRNKRIQADIKQSKMDTLVNAAQQNIHSLVKKHGKNQFLTNQLSRLVAIRKKTKVLSKLNKSYIKKLKAKLKQLASLKTTDIPTAFIERPKTIQYVSITKLQERYHRVKKEVEKKIVHAKSVLTQYPQSDIKDAHAEKLYNAISRKIEITSTKIIKLKEKLDTITTTDLDSEKNIVHALRSLQLVEVKKISTLKNRMSSYYEKYPKVCQKQR